MKHTKENNYYNWSVDKGDYKRDEEATTTYQKKKKLKKKIKIAIKIIFYLLLISAISYFLLAFI